jgi:hypothetical protein
MAIAVRSALEVETFNVVADAGYSNGEQAAYCEAAGMVPHVPATRTVNSKGNGTLYQRTDFRYQAETDTYVCPGEKTLKRRALHRNDKRTEYGADPRDCSACLLKPRCTLSAKRSLSRHTYEEALDRMQARVTPALMRLRRSTVEHPFATMKYRIFGHPRLLLRGLSGARTEIGLAVMAYNLKRMTNVLGSASLIRTLQQT